jgi:hypothetical protein
MTTFKKLFLIAVCITVSASLHAQLEVAQLFTKGQSATGFGANLHVGFPVPKGNEISGEIGMYYFAPGQSHTVLIPLLLGYRYTFNHSGTGWYAEPFAGYSFAGTDVPRIDAHGNPIINSDSSAAYQNPSGATAGLCIGYILSNPRLPLNFGLRFSHVFTSDDPSPSVLAFRVSWSVLTARHLGTQTNK